MYRSFLLGLQISSLLATLTPATAGAVRVYESELLRKSRQQALMIALTADELAAARSSRAEATRLGAEVATAVFLAVGVPESVTGKAAGLTAWPALAGRFASEIRAASKEIAPDQNATFKYALNLRGLRALWSSLDASPADELTPGSAVTRACLTTINRLLNAVLLSK